MAATLRQLFKTTSTSSFSEKAVKILSQLVLTKILSLYAFSALLTFTLIVPRPLRSPCRILPMSRRTILHA